MSLRVIAIVTADAPAREEAPYLMRVVDGRAVTVERMGVYFINGKAVDYTVEVTDKDGTFLVWARNLDRALQPQAKYGNAREFNLAAAPAAANDDDRGAWRPAPFRFAGEIAA